MGLWARPLGTHSGGGSLDAPGSLDAGGSDVWVVEPLSLEEVTGADPSSEVSALEEVGADDVPVPPVLPVGCVDEGVGWTGAALDAPLGIVGVDEAPVGPVG